MLRNFIFILFQILVTSSACNDFYFGISRHSYSLIGDDYTSKVNMVTLNKDWSNKMWFRFLSNSCSLFANWRKSIIESLSSFNELVVIRTSRIANSRSPYTDIDHSPFCPKWLSSTVLLSPMVIKFDVYHWSFGL